MDITEHDKRIMRCRMLGHEIEFTYCRRAEGELPCRKIIDCWFERFDIEQFLREHYTPAQIQKIIAPAQPKITTILELIQRASKDDPTPNQNNTNGT